MWRVQRLVRLDEQEAVGAAHGDERVHVDLRRLDVKNHVSQTLVQLPQLERETVVGFQTLTKDRATGCSLCHRASHPDFSIGLIFVLAVEGHDLLGQNLMIRRHGRLQEHVDCDRLRKLEQLHHHLLLGVEPQRLGSRDQKPEEHRRQASGSVQLVPCSGPRWVHAQINTECSLCG